jgi:flagellar hook-length control protein FliK
MSAENLVVKEVIEANLNQLKQQLQDLGLVVEKFEVMVASDERRFLEGERRAATQAKGKGRGDRSSMNRDESVADVHSVKSDGIDVNRVDVHV